MILEIINRKKSTYLTKAVEQSECTIVNNQNYTSKERMRCERKNYRYALKEVTFR